MKKTVLGLLVLLGVAFSSLKFSYSKKPQEIPGEFAPKGMVAYAASYSSDPKNEPKYSTQNSKTFQYLNLGKTHDLYRGDSVKVGIIDSGINYDHEDFMVNSATRVKGDSKYYAYQSSTWVYYKASQHGYSYIDDTLGHGTNVAATVAAAVNSIGGAGLAPNVELYVYKVTNSNNGYEFGAIQNALMDAQTLGIDIINMSFQSYEHAVSYGSSSMAASSGCSTILSYYLNQAYNAGITLVGAAGNYNTDEPSYPGSNNHVINVGSLNETGTDKAGFSNYGSTIDIVAPGYVHVADKGTNSSYKDTSGTSFSAPLVTAAIALYKQQNPSATPSQIESALYASCDPIDDSGSAYSNWAGNGALNVAKFLGCDVEDAPTEIIINNPEVVNEELELEVGDYLDLDYTVNGVGTFDDSVNFYTLSGDDNVVSVSSTGRITATGEGNDYVVIESNADPSVYASIYVTVASSGGSTPTVSSVSVSPASLSLDLNGTNTGTLTATVNGTNNPSQAVTWSSSNTGVATVSSSGVVTAKATGSVTITATSQEDGTKSGSCSVTVTDSTVHVTGVTLNKNSTTLTVGGNETLTAMVAPNNATNKNVTWSSSNSSVASVSNGTITAKAAGNTTITVSTVDGNHTATCTVTVNALPGPTSTTQYSMITSTSDLEVGKSYLIASAVNSNKIKTMSATDNTNNRPTVELSVSSNKVTRGSSALSVTLGGEEGAYTFKTDNYGGTAGYLNATSTTGSNYLQVVPSLDKYAYFSISFNNNYAVITCTGKSSRNIIRINTSGTPIACYTSGQNPVYLWKEVTVKTLSSISVSTAPTKTTYEAGEYFNPIGLVVTRNYSDSTSDTYTYANHTSEFSFTPTTSTALQTNNTSVTITYGGKSCNQAITVNPAKVLSSISISGYTTSFVEGDTFSFGGTVTAHYTDSTSANVTSQATFSGYTMTTLGNQTVTVSFGGKNETYGITVSQGALSSIAVTGMTTEYFKNYAFSFDGTCTATFANGYQKAVTPTSVSSPNMSTAGQKQVTVSFTYNGNTRTVNYNITVIANRIVKEIQNVSINSTITWPSSATPTIEGDLLSVSCTTSGKTVYESSSMRLGTSNGGGTLNISSSSTITKVDVVAKYYSSSYSSAVLKVNGTSVTPLTSSYSTYTVNISPGKTSFTILTENSNSRINIQSVKLYSETTEEVDISSSEDCQGLEIFIDTYMHMDYVQNLGYCKDNEHHYYSSAKTAFNALNTHQRSLFTTNTAYLTEWTRLSTWASINGDSLNSSNLLSSNHYNSLLGIVTDSNEFIFILALTVSSLSIIACFIIKKKRISLK